VAVDLGTTTLVAQLLDLETGRVLGVRAGLNTQAQHGADVMSRIEFAMGAGGLDKLSQLVRTQIGGMIADLLTEAEGANDQGGHLERRNPPQKPLKDVVLVGNTVMHHLFCRQDVTPLSHSPFEPTQDGLQIFQARDLGWGLPSDPVAHFLPCLGGFVGSDILGGLLATRLHESEALCALIDLGTNGEILLGSRERMVCASTAAGPAFEGARISMGMRAATGAISAVRVSEGQWCCHVLGHGQPRGICGSGLVDAAAAGLELGLIQPTGRLANGASFPVAPPVSLTQADIRELQLAKGAIAAGVRLLARCWGAAPTDITKVYLAGAFGNYINRQSARRIGLLQFPLDKVEPAGNTALLGAKLALFHLPQTGGLYAELRQRVRHICLHEEAQFQDTYVEEMAFPAA
jgi:uncharacterized 2Fe-2S/4Fe-4S cluster protein (DUF4445 family)